MESVANLSKEEFLKFLNCSAPPQKVTYTLRNKEKTFIKRKGKCTARNLTLFETALDNKVLRISLPRIDLKGLSKREVNLLFNNTLKRKRSIRQVSSYGRKLKKKKFHHEDSKSQKSVNDRNRSRRSTESNNVTPLPSPMRTRRSFNESEKLKTNNARRIIEENIKFTRSTSKSLHIRLEESKNDKSKSNGVLTKKVTKPVAKNNSRNTPKKTYYLSFPKPRTPVDGRLNYRFEKLVLDIKDVLLPGPTWKIKVIVRSNKITSIVFTNKNVVERSVTFGANSRVFQIVIDNKPAILLGAPIGVNNIRDIEVLLDIVHSVSSRNIMVLYK